MQARLQKGTNFLVRSKTNKAREILYYLIAFTFPFSTLAINISIILLSLILIIDLCKKQLVIRYKLLDLLLPLLFLAYAFSLFYTQDMDTGLRKLETKFSLLLLPAIICSYPLDKTVVKNILLWFISGVTLASLICVVNAFYVGYTKTGGVSILSNQYFYDRDFFVSIIGIQPPYFGLYLSAALLFLLSFAISSSIRLKNGILLVITSAVLMTALLLTYSRMALLALVIIFLLWMLHYLISQKKILLLVLCLLAFIVSVQIIYNDPFLNRRLVEIFNTPIREPGPEDNNSVSIRYGQIYCSLQILREHPLTGVGLGDTQEKLHECYRSRNYHPTFIEEKLNPHNQYLDIGISSGIMGILVLLLVYASLLYIFYNKKAKAALFFVALIVLTSMTETVLNSFKGVVLFSFFCSVFIALRSNNYEAKARKN